jgi:conjugal transfer/entry exclusion protein
MSENKDHVDTKLNEIFTELRDQRKVLSSVVENTASIKTDINNLKEQLLSYNERLKRVENDVNELKTQTRIYQELHTNDMENKEISYKKYTIILSVLVVIFTAINLLIKVL